MTFVTFFAKLKKRALERKSMYRILNYSIIICINLLLLVSQDIDSKHIIFFSFACILLFSSEFIEPKKIFFFISISYVFLCIIYPIAFLFFPIASYSHARLLGKFIDAKTFQPIIKYSPILYFPFMIVMWNQIPNDTYFQFFFLVFLSALSYLLEYHAYSLEHLTQKYIRSFDATRERNLYLKSKNDALIAKQDYEISLATMHERNRIARDIHDNVGHLLTRSILIAGAIKTMNKDEELLMNIDSLDTTLNKAMTSIRSSVHDLHSIHFNLEEAIQLILNDFSFCNVKFTFHASKDIPEEICFNFLAIIKEALTNAAKHSNATQISILLQEHPGLFQLVFEDNGTKLTNIISDGIGLKNMEGRIIQLQGNIHIRRQNGFRIFITIPKKRG